MIAANQLLEAIIKSLREVIAPAIPDPYPKSQAYMAAMILEFVSRQMAAGGEIEENKRAIMQTLRSDLLRLPQLDQFVRGDRLSEAELSTLIERLYGERDHLGEEIFTAANQCVRQALRRLIDQELRVAGKSGG